MNTKKRQKKAGFHDYFQGHVCHMTTEQLGYRIPCCMVRKYILDMTAVWEWDIRAQNLYRSYASLMFEKYRQYKNHPFSIHPFSKLRLTMDTILIFTLLATLILLPIQQAEINMVNYANYKVALNALEYFYILNIVMNFFTGYVEGNTSRHVVLDLKHIIWRYIRTWFIIDFISVLDVFINATECMYLCIVLVSSKALRCYILHNHIQKFLLQLGAGVITKTIFEITFFLVTYISWNIYFQFELEYLLQGSYLPVAPRASSWMAQANLWNRTIYTRLVYTLDKAVSMLRQNSNKYLLQKSDNVEYFYIVSWIVAKLIVFHCGFKFIINLFGIESARAKYFTMMQQVQNYVDQRRFPPRIKKKILKFYAIRFQSHFFLESNMMSCVSGQLREDIIMHTGRQLVSEVEFLKQLPRGLLLQIGLKLKIVIFIAGDIIFKINTIGDCLYFIDKGTVAVYSESGKEICHLEDGDFFGEIALVMKHRVRTATVVAVTNCELFRLSRQDFGNSVACYPTVYENIKKVAMSRFERTSVMDEHHKTEMSAATEFKN